MANNLAVTPGSGATIGMDEVTDGTLGVVKAGFGKIMDGTLGSTNKLIVTASGAAKTDGSATTQPVSGTFWQATQPVSAAALPLPTGAATSALQTQPGVDIGDVTINNAAGASAVNIQDGGNSITVDGSVTATVASTTITGTVAVTESGTWNVGSSTATAAAVPANAMYIGGNLAGNLTGATIIAPNDGQAAQNGLYTTSEIQVYNGATFDRLRGAKDALNSVGTGIPSAQMVAQFDDVSPTAITENQFGNVRMSANRNVYQTIRDAAGNERGVNVTAGNALTVDGSAVTQPVSLASVPSHAVTNAGTFAVQNTATSTGGYTPGKLVSAATTNATVIKASAGTLGHISASNVNAAARYLKFYNKATTPTVGTDVPVLTYIIPGNTAGAGTNIPLPPQGINFSTGISFAITVEATDAGSTGVAASEIVINYGFN